MQAGQTLVFVDTSAFYAILDRDDLHHPVAASAWGHLLDSAATLITTNYVAVETCALLQHRIGLDAVRLFSDDVLPVVEVQWVAADRHALALQSMLTANRRKLSLVDCASFLTMRSMGVRKACAFDQHFAEQGFEIIAV